jgi:hypothetical protein
MSFQNHLMSVKETSSLDNLFIFLGVGKEINQDSRGVPWVIVKILMTKKMGFEHKVILGL